MFWTNPFKAFECNSEIIEYDIKSGNASISKEYKLLPDSITDKWLAMDGNSRKKVCGLYQREHKDYAHKLEKCFDDAVYKFITANNLDKDEDIIAIKRDAVFVQNKSIHNEWIGDNIHFRPKNSYHAYLFLKAKKSPPFEFYFMRNGDIDLKGMNDELKELHKNGILLMLNTLVDTAEKSGMNRKNINTFMRDIVKMYKNKELIYDCYKTFSKFEGVYNIFMEGSRFNVDEIDEDMFEYVDISYNYLNVILPLQQTVC